jgi:hypothetical protein
MELDPKEISIVTNAIAFAIYSDDGREVKNIMGVEGIDADAEETKKCENAAMRALAQLTEYRTKQIRPMEDCWSGPMIKELVDAGIVPPWTQRVIIDIRSDNFARMHIEAPPTGKQSEKILDIITATVHPAEIITNAAEA